MQQPSPEQALTILESSPVALIICDADRVHYASPACAEALGFPEAADVCDLHPTDALIAARDQAAHCELLRRLLTGQSRWEQSWPRVRRRDGTTFRAHLRAQSVTCEGRTQAFITLVDVSQQWDRLQRLDVLTRAINSVSEAVLVTDADAVVLYANRALEDLLGAREDALLGAHAFGFVAAQAGIDAAVDALRVPGPDKHVYLQTELRRVTGETFPAELSITVFSDDEGRQLAIVIIRDLTPARRLDEERAVRERQLAVMLREAHHRIKNTLQVASDILALQAGTGSEQVRHALGAAANRIRALAAVHEGILADQDVTVVQAKPLIAAVVDDLCDASAACDRSVSFEITIEERPITSRAASALALITAELVSNSLKHGSPGTVRVWFWASAEQAVLEVRDNGAADVPAAGPGAAGFGLRLVRLLAEEQLRGDFSLERADGWTVARVRFPLPED